MDVTTNPVNEQIDQDKYWGEANRIDSLKKVLGAERLQHSPLARCVPAALVALDWFGAPRSLITTLPLDPQQFDAQDCKSLFNSLGFTAKIKNGQPVQTMTDTLPVGSLIFREDRAYIYLGRIENKDWWSDGSEVLEDFQPQGIYQSILLYPNAEFQAVSMPKTGSSRNIFAHARAELLGIGFVSFVCSVLALAISLFTMLVYNKVIPSGAKDTLYAFGIAAIIAVFFAWFLRLGRGRLYDKLSGWLGSNIDLEALKKTLSLSPDVSSRIGMNSNLSRMRSLSGIRTFFTGSSSSQMLDFPFIVVFLLVIAILGGWLVFVPIVGLLVFGLAAWIFAGIISNRNRETSRANTRLQEEIVAASSRLRALMGANNSDVWLKRLANISKQAAEANRQSALAMAKMQNTGYAIGMLTVLSTMAVGITLILEQKMSAGGLIATMMLIWRITTPAQMMFTSSIRLSQTKQSFAQFDRLMGMAGELVNPQLHSPIEELSAKIGIDRLYYRYSATQEPALNSVSFEISAGELVVVTGPNGAGKTTLMNCVAGILPAQSGRVLIDGKDTRQFEPSDYRAWLGYYTNSLHLLPVPVREFIKLRHVDINDALIAACFEKIAGQNWWTFFQCDSVASALDRQIKPWSNDPASLREKYLLGMVVALLDEPKLLLLDAPLNEQDPLLDSYLNNLIAALHGKTTVIIATHRPDLIKKADKVAILNSGNLLYFGEVNTEEQDTANTTENKETVV